MAIPAAFVVVPIGIIFIFSGIIVNLIQVVLFILVRPVSKGLSRRINKVVVELLWLELVWLIDWWAAVKMSLDYILGGVEMKIINLLLQKTYDIVEQQQSNLRHQLSRIMEMEEASFLNQGIRIKDIKKGIVGASAKGQMKKPMYLRDATFYFLSLCLVYLFEVYTDAETFQLLGKEHALLICNHRSDIDWLVGWVLAQRSGCLGSALAIMKKEAKFLPIIGWSMWFSEYIFLERNWTTDENTLKTGFKQLEDFPMPFWLALFVEGTRFTQAKLLAAQEYASSRGLPVPRNVLLPRTKGFISAVCNLRSFVPAIYDCTIAIPQNQPPPTMLRIFRGKPAVVTFQIKRHLMQELPETADGIAQWCKDVFVTKDALLEKYIAKGKFSDQEHQDLGRPKKSLFVVIFWSCLIVYGLVMLFQWSSILASWEVFAFSATFLVLVTIVMQILIQSSESERSTPPMVPPQDPTKERLLQI